MKRPFLILINCAILAMVFLGIPEATHAEVAGYQISKPLLTRRLIMVGLGLAVMANVVVAWFIKDRKARRLAWEWVVVFAGLGLLEYAVYRGYYNFVWLKHILLWLQTHL